MSPRTQRRVSQTGPVPGGTLDPTTVDKYVTPLVIPPAMPATKQYQYDVDYYEIAVRQFRQQILPAGLPATTVWGYGSVHQADSFNYPSFTIEAVHGRPVRIKWINQLIDDKGCFLPHLLPVDQTLHWANPPGGDTHRDSPGSDPTPYRGPVPIVTHVHGNHTFDYSDGYAEAWFLAEAHDIPAGFASTGSFYGYFRARSPLAGGWGPGSAVFEYPNDQSASTQWYHDHTLGLTRLNVYAGPAGFYLLRQGPGDLPPGVLPGPAPMVGDPADCKYYEIPLAIQDRSFNSDGSLFYPDSRVFFVDHFPGPYIPDSDVPPIWNPEFFANTMVVNGKTWPVLQVEPRRYRFRILNGCNSRFLVLKLASDPTTPRPTDAALPIWMIGSEGGFLPRPVKLDQLLLAPAERADIIVDFTHLSPGAAVYLINEGPDTPFPGPSPSFADPGTSGQVMKFELTSLCSDDTSTPPNQLTLPPPASPGEASYVRRVSLNELNSTVLQDVGPIAALLGTVNPDGEGNALRWDDQITENPAINAVEIWEIYNFTVDAHPIHIHEVQFQVINRQRIGEDTPQPPQASESGLKDTVIAYPGQITRVKAAFDLPGQYVWHCHIVEHEDNEMMRPYHIGPIPPDLP